MLGCARPPQKEPASLPSVVTPTVPEKSEPVVVATPPVEVVQVTPPKVAPPAEVKAKVAKVAIIIDDAGHNLKPMGALLALPVRFNVAVLPRLRHSKTIAEKLHEAGYEIMLHQPMEPIGEGTDPGPGAIRVTMKAEEITNVLEENFKSVPNLVGFNNHMGSKATADQAVMETVLKTALAHKLFFIDSVTSKSKVKEAAEVMGISIRQRDVFLDNEKDIEVIKQQLRQLKKIALKKGSAIGIGHFFPVTVAAIAEVVPEFEADGVEIVPASQLVNLKQ